MIRILFLLGIVALISILSRAPSDVTRTIESKPTAQEKNPHLSRLQLSGPLGETKRVHQTSK